MRNLSTEFAICPAILAFALALCPSADSQEHSHEGKAVGPQLQEETPEREINILFTGKLFGYFRYPDLQPPASNTASSSCPETRTKSLSQAAAAFEGMLRKSEGGNAMLVGMGDNFAPEFESRGFCAPPVKQAPNRKFPRRGKEFFFWDNAAAEWIDNDSITATTAHSLALGNGYIPEDNIAGFLAREGYSAIVPGKHDFYYGAERLRELAWLLAASGDAQTPVGRIHKAGVQMLGSNLVIDTTWKKDHSPLPDQQAPPWFIPRLPSLTDFRNPPLSSWKFSGLKDGATVYPWFPGVTISVNNASDDTLSLLASLKFSLCLSSTTGDPNRSPRPGQPGCALLGSPVKDRDAIVDNHRTVEFHLFFPWRDSRKEFTLNPGTNYTFCAEPDSGISLLNPRLHDKLGGRHFCIRFSTYTPFLQYPAPNVPLCATLVTPTCSMPEPYVLLEKKNGAAVDVAIFGVVAPRLPEYVGLLNLSWWSKKENYKDAVAAKDPAEALLELDASFERRYAEEHSQQTFRGIKVLLAQMSPEEANVLAKRLGKYHVVEYHVVVSAADAERSAYNRETSLTWQPVDSSTSAQPLAQYLAVPEPFYDEKRETAKSSNPWNVDIGSLSIQIPQRGDCPWLFKERHFSAPVRYQTFEHVKNWNDLKARLADCHTDVTHAPDPSHDELIQASTLCAIQKHTEADIAWLQKRDFFTNLADESPEMNQGQARLVQPQDFLDRLIWKGDIETISYLPGSIIQKVMAQSKIFDADDDSKLSLSDESRRGLVFAGIRYDSTNSEYQINGVPLDPNKLYSVAGSDFLSSGDTGYSDLAGSQVNPASTPGDFDKKLWKISSIVCKTFVPRPSVPASCLDSINRDNYFDDIDLAPLQTAHLKTPPKQFEIWSLFFHPGPVPGDLPHSEPSTVLTGLNQSVQQRTLWDLALIKWTAGITALGHSGSDFDVQSNFAGVSAPSVTAARTSTWASDMQLQFNRNWTRSQIQLTPAYAINTQYKGQPDDVRQVNQQSNLASFDLTGARFLSTRGPEHFDFVATGHFETPLVRTFNAFQLAATHVGPHGETIKDQLRFAQDRSYTLLLRPGARWVRRKSSLEFGPEWGHEWDALDGFNFVTNGVTTPCFAAATESISQCVKTAVKNNPSSILPDSHVLEMRSGHDHSGLYWKMSLTVPFHPRVSYVFTDTGDWFFVHFRTDNSTDTRFRDMEQHQLKLSLFPSLSIGPEVDLLLYQNSSTAKLPGHFLRQDTVMMKAQFSFDLFNSRHRSDQITYAPSTSPK